MALHLMFLFQVILDLIEFFMWSDQSLVNPRDHHILPVLQRLDLSLYFQYPKISVLTKCTTIMYNRMLIINSLQLINIILNTVANHKTRICIKYSDKVKTVKRKLTTCGWRFKKKNKQSLVNLALHVLNYLLHSNASMAYLCKEWFYSPQRQQLTARVGRSQLETNTAELTWFVLNNFLSWHTDSETD